MFDSPMSLTCDQQFQIFACRRIFTNMQHMNVVKIVPKDEIALNKKLTTIFQIELFHSWKLLKVLHRCFQIHLL